MKIYQPKTPAVAAKLLAKSGCTKAGIEIMKRKAIGVAVDIGEFSCSLGNILKQEALSCGADAAIHELSSRCGIPKTKIILIGNLASLQLLALKLQKNVADLPAIGKKLAATLSQKFPNN